MHPYLLLLALASLTCAACAGALYAHDPARRQNQLAGLLFLAVAFWGTCEITWNLAPDAQTALARVRFSALGWVFVGPLFLHLTVSSARSPDRFARRLVPVFYGVSCAAVPVAWFTPWVTTAAVRTSWGWGYEIGWGLLVMYAILMAAVVIGLRLVVRDFRHERSPAEKRQGPWLSIGVALPMLIAGLTDVALPLLGVQAPRFGTTSFAVMGALGMWTLLRFGYPFMTRGTFASEILSTLPDGVALVQLDEHIISANGALSRLSGYSADELTEMQVAAILARAETDDASDRRKLLDRATCDDLECELIAASGQHIPVSLSVSPVGDREGFPIGVVIVVRDLREVTSLRSGLLMSARLAAVGELAAGIAHEINNPLAFVRSNLCQLQSHWKLLRSPIEPGEQQAASDELFCEGEELIEESLEGVTRAAEIVRGVQGFSHGGSGTLEPANLNTLIDNCLQVASIDLRSRARIERSFGDLPNVLCAPQELKQVFLNLIVNAGHAIGMQGRIDIRTDVDGDRVAVHVIDDGCGIDDEIVDRIFDPFFTTKPVGDGTGLGLGIAYQIVRRHGGEITVTSTLGEGSHFRVLLPVALETNAID